MLDEKMIRKLKKIGVQNCIFCSCGISYLDFEKIDYVKTKRGSELWFHSECAKQGGR